MGTHSQLTLPSFFIFPMFPITKHFISVFFWEKPPANSTAWIYGCAGVGKAARPGAVTPNCCTGWWHQHSFHRNKEFSRLPLPRAGLPVLPRAFHVFLQESTTQSFLLGNSWPSGVPYLGNILLEISQSILLVVFLGAPKPCLERGTGLPFPGKPSSLPRKTLFPSHCRCTEDFLP